MGRAKATLKCIQKTNARKLTFTGRRNGIMKKISEISTICGVEACLIVYDGDGIGEPAIWPKDPSRVHSILEKYEHQKSSKEEPAETFDLENYFDNRKMMVEAEIAKVKKEILQMKYKTSDPCFNELTQEQLSFFIAKLSAKLGACDHRINMLKNEHHKSDQAAATAFVSMQNRMAQEINDNGAVMVDSTIQVDSTNQLGIDVNWDELILSSCDDTTKYKCDQAAATAFGSMQNSAQEINDNSAVIGSMQNNMAQEINDNSAMMVDSTIQVDSTNQLGDDVNWDELILSLCDDTAKNQCDQAAATAFGSMHNNMAQEINDNSAMMVDSAIQVDSTNQLGDGVNWDELILSSCDDTTKYQCDQAAATAFSSMQNSAQEINDNSAVMVDSTIQVDSTNQLGDDVNWDELVLSLCDDTAKYQCDQAAATDFSSMQNITHESVECSNPSQLNSMMKICQEHVPASMKSLNDKSGLVDSTVQVDVSLDSTHQLGDVNWDELEPLNWSHDSTNYQCDPMFWASQPDEPTWQPF